MLIGLASTMLVLPAEAESVLQAIPKVKTPPSAAKLPLQKRFLKLDQRYQTLSPANKLRLSQQRNDLAQSLGSVGSVSAMDSIEIESKLDRLSQRLSAARALPRRPIGPCSPGHVNRGLCPP